MPGVRSGRASGQTRGRCRHGTLPVFRGCKGCQGLTVCGFRTVLWAVLTMFWTQLSRSLVAFAAASLLVATGWCAPSATGTAEPRSPWVAREPAPPPLPASVVLAEDLFPALTPLLQGAVTQSPRVLSSQIAALLAEETRLMARAGLLPTVNLDSTWSLAQDRRLGDTDPDNGQKLNYFFQIRQPLYHWGALQAAHSMEKLAREVTEKNHAEVYRLLLLEIRSAYLKLVVLKARVQRAKFALRQAEEDHRLAQENFKSGNLPGPVVATIELQVTSVRLDLETKEEEYRLGRVDLARLTGTTALDDAAVPTLLPHVDYRAEEVAALHQQFLGNDGVRATTSVFAAQLELDREQLNYRVITARTRPKINLVTGVTQDEVSYTGSSSDRLRIQTLYAGFNVNWSIFDGFSTSAQKRASKLRSRQLSMNLAQKTQATVESIQAQVTLLDLSARRLMVAEKQLSLTDGLVAQQQEEFKRGNLTQRQLEGVLGSRDDLLITVMEARLGYMRLLADFLSSIGRDPALQYLPSPRP